MNFEEIHLIKFFPIDTLVKPSVCQLYSSPFGCCWDNKTIAFDVNGEGCPGKRYFNKTKHILGLFHVFIFINSLANLVYHWMKFSYFRINKKVQGCGCTRKSLLWLFPPLSSYSNYYHFILLYFVLIAFSYYLVLDLRSHYIGKKNKSHANEYLMIAIHFCQYASENVSVLQKKNQVFHSSKMS